MNLNISFELMPNFAYTVQYSYLIIFFFSQHEIMIGMVHGTWSLS